MKNKVRLLLDSGAYGAWTRNKTLDVREYGKYCLDNKQLIWKLVNLDVIPGAFGTRTGSVHEVNESARKSHINQNKLKDMGLRPIPVFHQGESIKWLETMLKEDEGYIGLSLSKFLRPRDQRRWLDMVFGILTNKDGRPFVKTHGFATTSFDLLTHYPWQSVDSTTWSLTPGYGQIIVPQYKFDRFDYLAPPIRVIMSGIPQKCVSAQERQFEGLQSHWREAVRLFVEDVVGSTLTKQRYAPLERCRSLLVYYREISKHLFDRRFEGRRATIFGPDHLDLPATFEVKKPWQLYIMFATEASNPAWNELLTETNSNNRLLSYWNLKDKPHEVLESFVTTGVYGGRRLARKRADWKSVSYLNYRALKLAERLEQKEDTGETSRTNWQAGDGRSSVVE